ncbi:hypothetical protein ACSZNZ_22955 [Aeromonas caviae]|uniref:hypothetical protein n=1 Tax=Gammaproteobacteria TaxID=1236 RepID=UPI0037D1CDCE
MIEFVFKEPLTCMSAMVAVICLIRLIYVGRKSIDLVEPWPREPEWADMINSQRGDAQQREINRWRNAVIILVLVAVALHFLGK